MKHYPFINLCMLYSFILATIYVCLPCKLIAQNLPIYQPSEGVIQRDTKDFSKKNLKIPGEKKQYTIKANHAGAFPRLSNIQPNENISIVISYPKADIGEQVIITVQDGGKLDNGRKIKVMQISKQKQLSFRFQVTEDLGLYRLVLNKGQDNKVLQFWVGNEPVITEISK